MSLFRSSVGSVAVAAAVTATAIGLGGGAARAAVPHPPAGRSVAATPGTAGGAAASTLKLIATISRRGLTLHGPRTFRAGRVGLTLRSVGRTGAIDIGSLKGGYTFGDLQRDLRAFSGSFGPAGPSGAGLSHLKSFVEHVTLYGGLDAAAGTSLKGTVDLPQARTYILYNDSGAVPIQPLRLRVTGPAVRRAATTSARTVIAQNDERFGGAATLPASGTITFRNASATTPQFLDLQHVRAGTTAQQVLQSLLSGSRPSFDLRGEADTDSISPRHSQTLTYRLPAGTYLELCFFPDLTTGLSYAEMGMIRVVRLG